MRANNDRKARVLHRLEHKQGFFVSNRRLKFAEAAAGYCAKAINPRGREVQGVEFQCARELGC
jgi:hypothetical protein